MNGMTTVLKRYLYTLAKIKRSSAKAAEKPAFLRIFKKAAEKLRNFLDVRKTCVFNKIAAEQLRLFLFL